MNIVATDVATITAVTATEGGHLYAEAHARLLRELRALEERDWTASTDCPEWTVRDMVGHIVGNTKFLLGTREKLRQMRCGRRIAKAQGYADPFDGTTKLQVQEHASLTVPDLLAELERVVPRALRGRQRTPRLLRRMPIPTAALGKVTMAYILDRVETRDIFMHRVDLAEATGRALSVDAAHEGRILADVVAEWADRLGKPFALTLTGPAGGAYVSGVGGPELTYDAVDFARRLAGRAPRDGLLAEATVLW